MATFTVTTLSDAGADGTTGGTLEQEQADGDGLSLREALSLTESLSGGANLVPDDIQFRDDLTGILRLVQGTLNYDASAIINGAGRITLTGDVDANDVLEDGSSITDVLESRAAGTLADNVRLFDNLDNDRGILLHLSGLTLTGGYVGPDGAKFGGAAVRSGSTVRLSEVEVAGNATTNYLGDGGAVFADTVDVQASVLRNNHTFGDISGGGAIFGRTGGITIQSSLIMENTIHGSGNGGGIFSIGSINIQSSSILYNRIEGSGGGGGVFAAGNVVLENSVIADNTINGRAGAGVMADSGMHLINTTVTGNIAESENAGGGGLSSSGFTFDPFRGNILLTNSIVSGNKAGDGSGEFNEISKDGFFEPEATAVLSGGNIIGDALYSGETPVATVSASQIFAETKTVDGLTSGVVSDNGGALPTVGINAAGVAVDAGDLALLPADILQDVRGEGRVSGGQVDLGALELQLRLGSDAPDDLNGDDASNRIDAGTGDDRIFGAGGADLILAGAGDDQVRGGDGDDDLQGGEGNDSLSGDAGDDTLQGGLGDDRLIVSDAGDTVIELTDEGYDRVMASISLVLGDHIEAGNLTGTEDLSMTAASTGTWIFANSGNNTLVGLGSNDRLDGQAGDDTITGGGGNDVLEGGAGRDVFLFAAAHGVDLILDFELGTDLVDLSATGLRFEDLLVTDLDIGGLVISDAGLIVFSGVAAAGLTQDQFDFNG